MKPEDHAEAIRAKASDYAQAKGRRVYLEEFRRTKKALLMKDALRRGIEAANAQEREALADAEYEIVLKGLSAATEIEEKLKWELESHRLDIEIWRTRQATERMVVQSHR
jgi:hypothetical protein